MAPFGVVFQPVSPTPKCQHKRRLWKWGWGASSQVSLPPTVLGDVPTGVFYVKPPCRLQRLCYMEAVLSPLGSPPSLLQELPL